jgi:hypothetical protein
VSAVVVVLLMRGRSGLGRRLRFGGLIAWHGRRIKHHAIELDRLLGVRLKRRNHHAEGKSQDRKTLHRSSPILCTLFVHAVEA